MTRKNPEKVREAKEAEEKKQRLDELLQACGVPNDERAPGKRWRRSYDVGSQPRPPLWLPRSLR
jgi:hypothetical protein